MNDLQLHEKTVLIDPAAFPVNVFLNRRALGLHWHEHYEMIYVTRGEAVFRIGQQRHQAGPGDILFVNGGELHEGYSLRHAEPVEYYAVVYDPALFEQIDDPHYREITLPLREGRWSFPPKVSPGDEAYPAVRRYLEGLIEECSMKQTAYEAGTKSLLALLLTVLARHGLLSETEVGRPDERTVKRFMPLFDYIDAHYGCRITVDEAARLVSLSPYHFCKLFKRATGQTFVSFVNERRVNKAEELLRSTDLPVTEIAERVGFGSINYFDRVFKKVKRSSPSARRK
ncbi:AraC family transcriptional regulator [Paenibacillus sp. S-38]|uniref:AraC family transcriptional regulator n=1 Tax=Paenibacillus sp. S-38 TaxID=3416710 RepID=UPI003CEF324B